MPEIITSPQGKQKRVYRWYATPWEILRQVPDLARYLHPDVTIEQLEQQAQQKSDTQAAREMQQAKRKLFARWPQKRSA